MPCNQPPFSVQAADVDATLHDWESASGSGQRWLILSDSPENVSNPGTPVGVPVVLYRTSIPFPPSLLINLRFFMWHRNATGEPRNLLIGLELESIELGGGAWQSHRFITLQSHEQAVGLCVAKGQLFGTLDDFLPAGGSLPPNTPVGIVLRSLGTSGNPGFYGGVHELTALGGGPGDILYVWTAFSASSDPGNSNTAVEPPDEHHMRGSWPYADLAVQSPVIKPVADVEWHRFSISCWPPSCQPRSMDGVPFIKRQGDMYGTEPGNKGLFGVNGDYDVRIDVAADHYASVYLRARNTGPDTFYQGAAHDITNDIDRGVPPIRYGPPQEGVRLINNAFLSGGATHVFSLPNATGGAATLPAEYLLGVSRTFPVPEPIAD